MFLCTSGKLITDQFYQEDYIWQNVKRKEMRWKSIRKTPKKNIEQTDFTAEFAREENPMKGFNRNSKRGREGKHNERPIE